MFKYRILALVTLMVALGVGLSSSSIAQRFDKTSSPSDWSVQAKVDPNQLITVRLRNKTNQTLVYALANDNSQRLAPGKTEEFLVRVGRQPEETSTILINTPENNYPLIYRFQVVPKNILTVEISPTSAANPSQKRTIYIDQQGKVYSF